MNKPSLKTTGLLAAFLLLLSTLAAGTLRAQDIFGVISGTVTDPSGAAVPGARIQIINEATLQTRTIESNGSGYYTVPQLEVGRYTVVASKSGFKELRIAHANVDAGGHSTIDLPMQLGTATESVSVEAAGAVLNTSSAEIARTVDLQQVQSLALNERNYVQLTTIVPGAATLTFDPTSLTTGMSTAAAAINGMRTDQNLYTVDGGYNMDSGSNSSQLNNVGIDFIEQVSVQTSNFSAEYGRNAGASVNVVTRSGGNAFHGGAFEFVRNDFFDAIYPSTKLNATPSTPIRSLIPVLRYNDFGWDLGGPLKHDKLFFFIGEEWKRIILNANPQSLTVPTSAELTGNFSDVADRVTLKTPANAPAGCSIVKNVLTAACISPDGKAIANVYSQMAKSAAIFNDTPTTNNVTFQPKTPNFFREDIARVDWHPSPKHAVYYRFLHDDINLIDPFGTFAPSGTLPTSPTNRLRPGYSHQIGYIWTASPNLINEAKLNASWNKQRIPPSGTAWERGTYNFQFPLPFPNAGSYPNGIPHVLFTAATGIPNSGVSQFTGPYFSLLAPTTDIAPSDTVTWQHGHHTLKFGAFYGRNRKDQNSRPDSYNGRITFQASQNPNTTGDPVADALMGNFYTFAQQSADPVGHFRFNNVSLFVVDNWKATPRLSLELGLRFERTTPTYTQGNNMANFDPTQYSRSAAPTSITSSNVPVGGQLDNGYVITGLVRPGNVPSDQVQRVPGATSSFVTAVPANAPRGFFPVENLFGPRVGLSFSPDNKSTLRLGYGLFFDKPEGNIIFGQPGVVPFLQSVSYQFANLANPSAGTAGAATIYGLSAVQPDLRVARTSQYSLSMQRQVPFGLLLEAAYVGNIGKHLLRQPNINGPSFQATAANPGVVGNNLRPYFGYLDITQFRSDSMSDYNGLQVSAIKRRGNIIFTVNYTWSKTLGTTSGEADNPEPECPFSCLTESGAVVSWNRFYYGPLSFDRRHIFTATYTYNLPLFRSRHDLLGSALGGWSINGITRAQTGQLLTPATSASIGPAISGAISYTRRADRVPGVPLYSGYTCPAGKKCWANPAAFKPAATTGVGSAPVGAFTGPGFFATDLNVRKTFTLRREMNLLLQADAFNIFNQTNWGNPGTNPTTGFGQITSSQPPRQMQFGAKFNF